MTQQKATNITWHPGHVTREERMALTRQKPCCVWLTGLSACGKSTIAMALEQVLIQQGHVAYVLDGDNIRHGLNKNLGFSPEDRAENIRRIGEVAKLFVDAGLIVITSFISPYREDRDRVRQLLAPGEFIEVFVDAPIEVCASRDPKGLYEKAMRGEIKGFTGVSPDAPYEPPLAPELHLRTDQMSVEECVAAIMDYLETHGHFQVAAGPPPTAVA
ncbi:MAG: adenylyl-sulfate kinase [Candidatus Sumerlaea chitinivorans]|nr:adenylyl-sulfate kinase [Candidatus Sumerlaea chitinivorans]